VLVVAHSVSFRFQFLFHLKSVMSDFETRGGGQRGLKNDRFAHAAETNGQHGMSKNERGGAIARVAALRADAKEPVQELMRSFAERLSGEGLKVAGVIQARVRDAATGRERVVLRDVSTGAHYPISQDLGPGSVACNLDTGELAAACAAVERAARSGADLIVISKFSKQEAERGGLSDAFRAAIASKAAIVTAVSPYVLEEWGVFAGALAEYVSPDHASLDRWFRLLRGS
jgi:hypothetical protein